MRGLFKNRIVSKFVLNPFLWFGFIWLFVLLIHSFNFSTAYPALNLNMGLFFGAIILISFVLAVVYHNVFLKKLSFVPIQKSKPSYIFIILSYVFLVAEVLYSKQLPILSILKNDMMAYQEFGVPAFTFLNTTFVYFIALLSAIKICFGERKYLWGNIAVFALCLLRFLLLYSRGSLILCMFFLLLAFVSKRKITLWLVLALIVLGVLALFAFNALGNIRLGEAWNDSSRFLKIAKINPKYYGLKNIIWTLTYLDSPIGNLLYNEANVSVNYSGIGLLSQLFPDFLAKRLFPNYNNDIVLPIYGLNVASMFAGGFKYYGYFGMTLVYLEMVAFIFIVSFLCKGNNKYFIVSAIGLTFITIMSFFDNMVTFSGYSFYLLYAIVCRFIEKGDEAYVTKEKIKLIIQAMCARGEIPGELLDK